MIYGSGSAGLGIARQLRDAMRLSSSSLSDEEAGQKFWLIDKHGLIKKSLGDKIRDEIEKAFIRQEDDWGENETDLLEIVKRVKPTVLIGTSTHPGAFTEEVIKEMSKHVDRPIIFPVRLSSCCRSKLKGVVEQSNQALRGGVRSHHRVITVLISNSPKDANNWSNGKALMATGSPFPPVDQPGSDKKYTVAECNNVSHHLLFNLSC